MLCLSPTKFSILIGHKMLISILLQQAHLCCKRGKNMVLFFYYDSIISNALYFTFIELIVHIKMIYYFPTPGCSFIADL